MNRIVLSLLLFVSSLSWAEECFEGSQIQISGKIIDIGSEPGEAYTRCISKEVFNICTAEPEGWDLSLVEKDEICFGY